MGFLSALFGDPPAPPNPIVTAGAQTASNLGTALVGSHLNNYNQETPSGNLTYNTTDRPSYNYVDPLTGQTYITPQWTVKQTLSPEGQKAFDATQRTATNLATTGEASSKKIGSILGTAYNPDFDAAKYLRDNPDVMAWARTAVNPDGSPKDVAQAAAEHYEQHGRYEGRAGGAPQAADPNSLAGGGLKYGFDDVGQLTRSYGPADGFSADRLRVEQSMYERMNPQLKQDRERLEQQLADQGLQPGTEAYNRAYDMLNRQTTDARLAITAKGGEEQQRLNDMAAQQATFQNAAQRDAFTQAATKSQFFNAAKAQEFAEDKVLFDATNQTRDKRLQELHAARVQPLQEISALQSGSQVSQPNFVGGGNQQVANTDVAGIINANFNQSLENYKTNSANVNNIVGGLFGLASAGVKASDRRVKKNVAKLGSVYMADRHDAPKKLPVYSYEYKGSDQPQVGPMAQDVEKIDPDAVTEISGIKHIRSRKVLGDILRVA